MARPRSENVQINIAIPGEWKKELENLARIYSVENGRRNLRTLPGYTLWRKGGQSRSST